MTAAIRHCRLPTADCPLSQESLVAEAVGFAAIGAIPRDAVTGKTPKIFIHAALADGEPAMPAFPAEPQAFAAAMADGLRLSVFFSVG
ncbi:hypothetical protein [Desulfatirhabdium butyrativorans]|uniref:hypothetical protein n=1 Tax=Desulfatirhabdium butyrativorans TaxID=340467 RepID=UPI0012EBF7D2|nr:hypothetical protein [Desulfatirhabdium butyrativorans]